MFRFILSMFSNVSKRSGVCGEACSKGFVYYLDIESIHYHLRKDRLHFLSPSSFPLPPLLARGKVCELREERGTVHKIGGMVWQETLEYQPPYEGLVLRLLICLDFTFLVFEMKGLYK